MNYNPKIHNRNHLVKSIVGRAEYFFSGLDHHRNELIVVNYHGTQKKFIDNFKRQLDFFLSNFRIISPSDVPSHFEGNLKSTAPSLLINFDDGIKNNLYAVDIINSYKIKAFFFVVPDYIDTAVEKQKEYFVKKIRLVTNSNIDNKKEDFISMTWEELKDLQKTGHSIGSHSRTHTIVAANTSDESCHYEIITSKNRIVEMLGVNFCSVNSYCSPNESSLSTGKKEMELIKKNYRFFYSTYPGSNIIDKNPFFIKRSNIEIHWTMGGIQYAINRWIWKRWEKKVLCFTHTI